MDDRLRADLVREIREFVEARWPSAAEGSASITDRRLRLGAAVLMVCVLKADGVSRRDEHRALQRAVGRALDLEAEDAMAVVRAAEEAVGGGAAFASALQQLVTGCSHEQKRRLVEELWRIAFADAELAGHEEYLVRKVAESLGLTRADLVETKVRARETFLREDL